MIVRDADFTIDFASLRFVRATVFIAEQNVPADIEFDDRDPLCRHVLALEGAAPVGTGRLDVEYGGKVGRVAVIASRRRGGVGTAVMERLHEIARAHDLPKLWCHAQLTAVPFYERLGYRPTGAVFVEADIDHVRMERDLR
ncbi:MAG TPA: GNAT family N-acetyltransferase [Gammaproteobacteria bacterium]|nr:GNAT family N-acetyltransferase [Gammaproteobacteria bacterium]